MIFAVCAFVCSVHAADNVTLLVPGIVNPLGVDSNDGGGLAATWKPLLSALDKHGYSFGGVIRFNDTHIQLPRDLAVDVDQLPGVSDSRSANVFAIEFSPPANTDGLAFRSVELAEALRALREFTGRRINIVAHSAGGLAARVVLQEACPGVGGARDAVARLLTIGTPHSGAAIANNFGDLVGTRATSLKPDAGLIRRLNALDFPESVSYTSIVIRSLGSDVHSPGEAYSDYIDPVLLRTLPWHLERGGDEVVHVRSQNLRLVPTVAAFEKNAQEAVQAILVRVKPPPPAALNGPLHTVHVAALADSDVHEWVIWVLKNDGSFWRSSDKPPRRFVDWQIRQTVIGLVEREVLSGHVLREVTDVQVRQLDEFRAKSVDGKRGYRFTALASWRELISGRTQISGWIAVELDPFGRIASFDHEIDR